MPKKKDLFQRSGVRQFERFLFSSLSATVIDLGLFTLFCALLRQEGSVGYVAVATVLARIVSSVYNYLANYFFVFHSHERVKRSAALYVGFSIAQMLCSAALTTTLVALLPAPHETLLKMVVDVGLFPISYVIQRKFIY